MRTIECPKCNAEHKTDKKDKRCKDCYNTYMRDYYCKIRTKREYKICRILGGAKGRAKKLNIPFELTSKDIVLPKYCPVLGIKLGYDNETLMDNSPTLDRVVPSLGYIKGNVNIISNRANRIKSDASEKELEDILRYVKKHV